MTRTIKLNWILAALTITVGGVAAAAGCTTTGAPGESEESVGHTDDALTGAQCSFFDVNGTVQICHKTGSVSHPYTILKTSVQGCINGHVGHAADYVTSTNPASPLYDPTCNGQGCLPATAPCDGSLECCTGLACTNGVCTAVSVDPCIGSPCVNGTCSADGSNYTCTCDAGWGGTDCNVDIDECASDPCFHGECVDEVNDYSCDCAPGYEGSSCDVDIDECGPQPCVHGDCTDLVNAFECTCYPGYTGADCDIDIDDCASDPCFNGGCADQVNGYSCDCLPGFTGPSCETPEGPITYNCETKNPCTQENIDNGSYYFAHDDPQKFVQCDDLLRCFEMSCGPGLVWDDAAYACVSP